MKKIISSKFDFMFVFLGVIITTLLLCLVNLNVNSIYENEAPYTNTEYDFIVTSKSINQNDLQNIDHIDNFVPYVNYSLELSSSGKKSSSYVMIIENDAKIDDTFFNKDIIIEGKYSSDGIMIDKTVADVLDVKVGDELSYTIKSIKYTYNISAIYLSVNTLGYTSGVAMVHQPSDFFSDYTGAFVKSNNISDTSEYLNLISGLSVIDKVEMSELANQRAQSNKNLNNILFVIIVIVPILLIGLSICVEYKFVDDNVVKMLNGVKFSTLKSTFVISKIFILFISIISASFISNIIVKTISFNFIDTVKYFIPFVVMMAVAFISSPFVFAILYRGCSKEEKNTN